MSLLKKEKKKNTVQISRLCPREQADLHTRVEVSLEGETSGPGKKKELKIAHILEERKVW